MLARMSGVKGVVDLNSLALLNLESSRGTKGYVGPFSEDGRGNTDFT